MDFTRSKHRERRTYTECMRCEVFAYIQMEPIDRYVAAVVRCGEMSTHTDMHAHTHERIAIVYYPHSLSHFEYGETTHRLFLNSAYYVFDTAHGK